MIVVDTNVVAYLIIAGDHTESAAAVFARDPDWVVPSLWRSEFRNLLVLYVRRGELALDDALVLMARGEVLLASRERGVHSEHVLRLAAASGCTAYDCEFVAVAQAAGVPLVTADRKVVAAFPTVALSPAAFLA
ncbi:MAG TPA: type II toxin-antitoxin system VapC family toxin [Longimicrobiaceae bacterium]|nr:type II toxin-antitoxin system VapC family toxin [Longimicrobiaceae bacterium]